MTEHEKTQSSSKSTVAGMLLRENGLDFFTEALRRASTAEGNVNDWKFAIFNLVQGIELTLKRALSSVHPSFIYRDVDKPTVNGEERTVSLLQAIQRLRRVSSIEISEADEKEVETANKWRNRIVHYQFSINATEAKALFANLLAFANHFHLIYFGESVASAVPATLWDKYSRIEEYQEQLLRRATAELRNMGVRADEIYYCPTCGSNAYIVTGPNRCLVCGWQAQLTPCYRCGEPTCEANGAHMGADDQEGSLFCVDCIDFYATTQVAEEV